MMPEKIEKNMYLRRHQGKNHTTMMPKKYRYFMILIKSRYYDAQKYWKNMYLRRHQGKIKLLWCPKNTDNLWFFVKITLLWCPKILKKHVSKTTLRQNQTSMMPKKYR